MGLFTQANYRFSSKAPNRPSTFYFSDHANNCGRYRRQHANGPELVYQGRCNRIFVSPELEAKISVLSELTTRDDDDYAYNEARYGKFGAIYPMLQRGDPDGIYRGRATLTVQAGWRLFDSNGAMVHLSAGSIQANDPEPPSFCAWRDAASAAYSGAWTIW